MSKQKAYLTYWGGDTASSTYAIEGYVFGHPTVANGTFIRIEPSAPKTDSTNEFNKPNHTSTWHSHLGGQAVETEDIHYELGPTGYYGVEKLILNKE